MMRLIGRRCTRRKTFSRAVLIGRALQPLLYLIAKTSALLVLRQENLSTTGMVVSRSFMAPERRIASRFDNQMIHLVTTLFSYN